MFRCIQNPHPGTLRRDSVLRPNALICSDFLVQVVKNAKDSEALGTKHPTLLSCSLQVSRKLSSLHSQAWKKLHRKEIE
ncbi:hypothetical protein ANCCAN_08531 [Ancylostoma caninum]|uniref:Uncharacterized protein n=1 Tax=Ancylostoma caninum TaxID=29170 RepID=A0A368GM89_ANCCA|nr:hypothetical protein ANCCAN_08531 [Ancylostoma caninum]